MITTNSFTRILINFGLGNFGFAESLIVLLAIVALTVWPGRRICRKAGYFEESRPPALPSSALNVGLWLYLAFAEWPLERRARGTSRDSTVALASR